MIRGHGSLKKIILKFNKQANKQTNTHPVISDDFLRPCHTPWHAPPPSPDHAMLSHDFVIRNQCSMLSFSAVLVFPSTTTKRTKHKEINMGGASTGRAFFNFLLCLITLLDAPRLSFPHCSRQNKMGCSDYKFERRAIIAGSIDNIIPSDLIINNTSILQRRRIWWQHYE